MLLRGEKEIGRWRSITATNFRIIQKKGIFWTRVQDINYDHLSSIFMGRKPLWPLILVGLLIIILFYRAVPSGMIHTMLLFRPFHENVYFLFLLIAILLILRGVIGRSRTIFYGTNSKIEESGKSVEFMTLVNDLRLRYRQKIMEKAGGVLKEFVIK
jgi:hypothetical protein